MRVFVGFGYNERDSWIERHVYPLLRAMAFTVTDGKDMHGQVLQPGVQSRIEQSDAVIGFFTVRDGQGDADFNSHIWVRDEVVYAHAKSKPIILVRESGVRVPDGLLGNRQYIPLAHDDRLACVVELIGALGRRSIRRLKLDPVGDQLARDLWSWRKQPGFEIKYRTRDQQSIESQFKPGRLELVDQGFFLNVADVPVQAFVEVEGFVDGSLRFSSGWVSADAVQVRIA